MDCFQLNFQLGYVLLLMLKNGLNIFHLLMIFIFHLWFNDVAYQFMKNNIYVAVTSDLYVENEQRIKLKYGFNHRYHDSVCEALRIIKSGELGEIVNLRGIYGKSAIHPIAGEWRAERKYSGGGILLDQGIHMIDLMQLFCGDFY